MLWVEKVVKANLSYYQENKCPLLTWSFPRHIQGNCNCGYDSHSAVKPNELELGETLVLIIHVSPKFSPLFCISHSEGYSLPFCEDNEAALRREPHGEEPRHLATGM